jgi:hypothetical protein
VLTPNLTLSALLATVLGSLWNLVFPKVRVTRDLGTRVEVDTGIKAGDQVILNPPVTLIDGSKVQLHPEAAAPDR